VDIVGRQNGRLRIVRGDEAEKGSSISLRVAALLLWKYGAVLAIPRSWGLSKNPISAGFPLQQTAATYVL
jgi:hypothetical protein